MAVNSLYLSNMDSNIEDKKKSKLQLKIAKLIHEGRKPAQAVAIAHSMLGKSKKKGK